MKKLKHLISYQLLLLKSYITKTKLQYLGKDYFIYWANVVKIDWLHIVICFSYKKTIKYLSGHKFYINWETIIDIEKGIEVLFHGVKLMPNTVGYIINNKQYNYNLELVDDWDVFQVFYNFLITTKEQNGWILYKIMNLKWEPLYQMFGEKKEKLNIESSLDKDFATFTIWNNKKELHVSGLTNIISEV